MPSPYFADFLPQIVARHPSLQPLLDEHLEDFDHEIAPHLLMSDLQDWAVATVATDPAEVTAFLADLQDAFERGDTDVVDCISLSFLDGLPRSGGAGGGVRALLPPVLAEDLATMEAQQ